jgi:hypothetical protein
MLIPFFGLNQKIKSDSTFEFKYFKNGKISTKRLVNTEKIHFGYYLGFRSVNNNSLLSPIIKDTQLIITGTKNYNISGEDYIFLRINDSILAIIKKLLDILHLFNSFIFLQKFTILSCLTFS